MAAKGLKRNKGGQFIKGTAPPNPEGRPKGSLNKFSLKELKAAIREVEQEKQKPFLKHFIERAYSEDRVLVNAIRKMIPDLKSMEIKGSADGDFNITVIRQDKK